MGEAGAGAAAGAAPKDRLNFLSADQGKLSTSPDGLIDTAELVRVMSTMNVHGERQFTPLDTSAIDAATGGSEHSERPVRTSSEHQELKIMGLCSYQVVLSYERDSHM